MSKRRVLVVEDDTAIRNAVTIILERNGYHVLTAVNGEHGLLMVDQVDVILLDLLMPVLDGEEFLKRIRSEGNYIPVVLMSAAYGRDESLLKLKDLKIVDFLEKPFTSSNLLDQIKKAFSVVDTMKTVEKASDDLKEFLGRQPPPGAPAPFSE